MIYRMFLRIVIMAAALCISLYTIAQPPPQIQWQRTIGGSDDDRLMSIIQTNDNGYIAVGYSKSGISGDKTEPNRGQHDYWIIKLDANGNTQWQKTYGGAHDDVPYAIIQTQDGGYFVTGNSQSDISGDKTEVNRGVIGSGSLGRDSWSLKLDANGNIQWQKTYGCYGNELAFTVIQRSHGGYVLNVLSEQIPATGYPTPDRNTPVYGWNDFWPLKLDAAGTLQYQRAHGGDRHDNFFSMIPTFDGGYMAGGLTGSAINSGTLTSPRYGGFDNWLIKMDSNFIQQWQTSFGGAQDDWGIGGDDPYANSGEGGMEQTIDSGYIIGNSSKSGVSGNKTEASFGLWDWWVVQLDKSGAIAWQKELGGTADDQMATVIQTVDTGYLAAGTSASGISGNKTVASRGDNDYWLVKLDKLRNIQWQLAFGGSGDDHMTIARKTRDGGYILGGFSKSNISGEKIENSRGDYDFWIIKLGKCDTTFYTADSICKGDTYRRRNGTLVSQAGVYIDTLHSTIYCDTILITTLTFRKDTSHLLNNALLGNDTALCEGKTLLLNATHAGIVSYVWNTGATGSLITVSQTNDYWVHATMSNGCINKDTVTVLFTPNPVVDLKDVNICESDAPLILRSPQAVGTTYIWSNGLSDSTMAITRSGKYWLQVKNTTGCIGSDTVNVKVIAEPEVNVGLDTIICAQIPVKIGTEIPNATYLWSTGETTSYIYADSTADYVLDVNIEGCHIYDTVHITAMPAPAIDLGETKDICLDQVISLDATTPEGAKYKWNTGATTAIYNATNAGLYWVQVTSEYGCVSADSILLKYFANPTIILPDDTVVCEETPLVLKPVYSINETSLLWSTGSVDRQITVTQGGQYYIEATNKCGTDRDTINIRQIFCDIWLPNAFTPNGDGVNDVLKVLGNIGRLQDFSLSIYNRWGELVFTTTDKYSGWNGMYKAYPAAMDTYVYLLQYSRDGVLVKQKGNVTLIR